MKTEPALATDPDTVYVLAAAMRSASALALAAAMRGAVQYFR